MANRHCSFPEAVRSATEAAATAQRARDEAADPACFAEYRHMFIRAAAFWQAVADAQAGVRWWGRGRCHDTDAGIVELPSSELPTGLPGLTEQDGRRAAGQLGSQFGAFG